MKNIRGKLSLICILLGAALILGAAGVLVVTGLQDAQAEADVHRILAVLQERMPPAVDAVPEERGNNRMASLQLEGVNVSGLLEFPQYGKELPLAASWDTKLVSAMPCRFTGSIYDSSLIIGATDGEGQLSFAGRMEVGDRIVLTDMEGGRYTYRVEAIHHAKHASLVKLQEGEYPLTVFVKDSKTSEYLLIRCGIGA